MAQKSIRLHIGAHRTGTSALQATLDHNVNRLKAYNVAILTPWRVGQRDHMGLRLVTRSLRLAKANSGIARWRHIYGARKHFNKLNAQKNAHILIMSDEEFLGIPFSYIDGESIYPHCAAHLHNLARILPAKPERIHLTIRDYAGFLTSVYAMSALYRGGAPRFEAIKPKLFELKHRWPHVLFSVRKVFPDSAITFSRYGRNSVETALNALLLPEVSLENVEKLPFRGLNTSPTSEAIEEALRSHPGSAPKADRVVSVYANGTYFDPLALDEKKKLVQIYTEDLCTIKKHYKEVRAEKTS
ncbi:MAG: hypothetical protein ACLFTG_05770 [Alphaproteobacteria bacterium]